MPAVQPLGDVFPPMTVSNAVDGIAGYAELVRYLRVRLPSNEKLAYFSNRLFGEFAVVVLASMDCFVAGCKRMAIVIRSGNVFQVFCAVVRFVTVLVIDLHRWRHGPYERLRNNTVPKDVSALSIFPERVVDVSQLADGSAKYPSNATISAGRIGANTLHTTLARYFVNALKATYGAPFFHSLLPVAISRYCT